MKKTFFVLLLAGCTTVGPDYKRPEMPLPEQFPRKGSEEGASVASDWWTLYSDATLNELVASARSNNADLRVAAAQVQEAEAVMSQARAALFPEVSGQFTRTRSRVGTLTAPAPVATAPLERNDARLVASTSFELDFWGRFSRADEAARANLLGSQIAREVVGLTIGGVTAQTYFGLRSLDAQMVALDNTIRLRRESLDIAQARASAGLASELDVHQAQGALSDALVQRREAGRQRALLERQLAQLSGRLDLKVSSGDLFALPVPPTPPAGLPSSLLERRPDIRAAEQQLIAANANIGAARAAFFPRISLTANFGTASTELSGLFKSGSWAFTGSAQLLQPIFDAGRNRANLEVAEATRAIAVAQYEKAIQDAFREVADALAGRATFGEQVRALAAQTNALAITYRLADLRYRAGASSYLEALDAQRQLFLSQQALVQSRGLQLQNAVTLYRALGGGWTEPPPP